MLFNWLAIRIVHLIAMLNRCGPKMMNQLLLSLLVMVGFRIVFGMLCDPQLRHCALHAYIFSSPVAYICVIAEIQKTRQTFMQTHNPKWFDSINTGSQNICHRLTKTVISGLKCVYIYDVRMLIGADVLNSSTLCTNFEYLFFLNSFVCDCHTHTHTHTNWSVTMLWLNVFIINRDRLEPDEPQKENKKWTHTLHFLFTEKKSYRDLCQRHSSKAAMNACEFIGTYNRILNWASFEETLKSRLFLFSLFFKCMKKKEVGPKLKA